MALHDLKETCKAGNLWNKVYFLNLCSLRGAFWVFYNGVQTPQYKYVTGVFPIDFFAGARRVIVPQDK